jgi:hypothetical protein
VTRYRSKTIATWLAIVLGPLGGHRLYLNGPGDTLGWLHVLPSAAGLVGVLRWRGLGQDDHLAWLLIPLLGLMISQAMLCAIVYGLTPDEVWDARRNPESPPRSTRWAPVLGAILALMIGGVALMGTLAFSGQKFFEWQLEGDAQNTNRLTP